MAGAVIVLNQSGHSAGVPGQGRDDLSLYTGANDVVLTNENDSGVTPGSHLWTLVSKPEGSVASILNPTQATAQLRPDIEGSYKIQLDLVDSVGPQTDATVAGVKFPNDWRIPAPLETTEVVDVIGWARAMDKFMRDLAHGVGFWEGLTLKNRAADPSPVASSGIVYPKALGGSSRPFWMDQAGEVSELAKTANVVRLRDWGIRGDGTTDNSSLLQAAINANPDGSFFLFDQEPGEMVSKFRLNTPIALNDRHGLTFVGCGRATAFLRGLAWSVPEDPGADQRLFTIGTDESTPSAACSDINFVNIDFDFNGIGRFGGVVNYGTDGLRFVNSRGYDSAVIWPGTGLNANRDHYFIVHHLAKNVLVWNCQATDVELIEGDTGIVVDVLFNTITRATGTVAIGAFAVDTTAQITISGVVITAVSPETATGNGTFTFTAAGTTLQWQAPGSGSPGAAVAVAAGGYFTLLGGDGSSIRVLVTPSALPGGNSSDVIAMPGGYPRNWAYDYTIFGNKIIDPTSFGILVSQEDATNSMIVRNLRVEGNTVIHDLNPGATSIGFGYTAATAITGSTWENIKVTNNTVICRNLTRNTHALFARHNQSGFQFKNAEFRDNTVVGPSSEDQVFLRQLKDSDIARNKIHGASLGYRLEILDTCLIDGNLADCSSRGFGIDTLSGNNVFTSTNRVTGGAATPWTVSGSTATDFFGVPVGHLDLGTGSGLESERLLYASGRVGPIDGTIFTENAAVPGGAPASGRGTVWVRSSDSSIVFTSDAAVDHALVYADGTTFTRGSGVAAGTGLVVLSDANASTARTAALLSIVDNNVAGAGASSLSISRDNNTNSPRWAFLTSTDSGTDGPMVEIFHDSASPAVGDALGHILATGRNSIAGKISYADIRPIIVDPNSTSEDGGWDFYSAVAGTLVKGLRMYAAASGRVIWEADSSTQPFTLNATANVSAGTEVFRIYDGNLTNFLFYVDGAGVARASGGLRSDAAGSGSAPAYSFANDLNTGMFQNGVDSLGGSAGGATTWVLSADQFILTSSSSGAVGMEVQRYQNSGSAAVSDVVGLDTYYGSSSTGVKRLYGSYEVQIASPTNTTETGLMIWRIIDAGASNEVMNLTSTGVLSVDDTSVAAPAVVGLFDDYDDSLVLKEIYSPTQPLDMMERLCKMGIARPKTDPDEEGYMVSIPGMMALLGGASHQNRARIDDLARRIGFIEAERD